MSEKTAKQHVTEAADFLDRVAEASGFKWLGSDWRSKIDTSTLTMLSTSNCVLGQLVKSAGSSDEMPPYDFASQALEAKYPVSWANAERAFGAFKNEWVAYLSHQNIDTKATWFSKFGQKRAIKDVTLVTLGDNDYVTFHDEWDSPYIVGERYFLRNYEIRLPFEYVRGDVLVDQHSGYYFVKDEEHVVCLKTMTWADYESWCSQGFTLTKSDMKSQNPDLLGDFSQA